MQAELLGRGSGRLQILHEFTEDEKVSCRQPTSEGVPALDVTAPAGLG